MVCRPGPPGNCSTRTARYGHPRLAYRDVAAPTNRLTLIAAIVPPRVITTHTLFCLKGRHDLTMQQFLCGVFNSFVANYLVRLWVGMHVTVAIVARLPVPFVATGSVAFADIASLAARLATQADREVSAALQARVAHLYGIPREEFRHILGTFPLIPLERTRSRDAGVSCRRVTKRGGGDYVIVPALFPGISPVLRCNTGLAIALRHRNDPALPERSS